jgi:plastocyanin
MKTNLKRLSAILLILVSTTLFISCGKGGSSYNNSGGGNNGGGNNGGGGNNSSNNVSIANFAFSSADITVTKGTTVAWKNNDGVTHTVTADDGSFDSGSLTPGKSFSHTFDSTGTFTYHCNIHTTMTGKVTVQ